MKSKINIMMLMGVLSVNTIQAAQYNPWRPMPQQWGYQGRVISNNSIVTRPAYGTAPQRLNPVPLNRISARQFEYRRYIQEMDPYYSNKMPWWSDQSAVPYGPWSKGANGFR